MKRRLFKLSVFLLIGAIVNVAVSWTAVCRARASNSFYDGGRSPIDDDLRWLVDAGWKRPDQWGRWPVVEMWIGEAVDRGSSLRVVVQMGDPGPDAFGSFNPPMAILSFETASGWPFHSLEGAVLAKQFVSDPQAAEKPLLYSKDGYPYFDDPLRRWSLDAPPSRWLPDLMGRILPLRPIWPGFAIDTAMFATAAWLLFAAPWTLRRRLRLRRGLCAHCAYPVGSSPICTECGRPIARRR